MMKKSIRIGYPIKDNRGKYYAISNWFHLKCASNAFYHEPDLCEDISSNKITDTSESLPVISRELLKDQMVNFEDLVEDDKQYVLEELQPRIEDESEEENEEKEPTIKPRLISKNIKNVSLLKFQEEGLYWLKSREDNPKNNGGILADEMGMGKTIQMIALIAEQKSSPTLVICPTAAVLQWRNEILKFTSNVDVRIYHGTNKKEVIKGMVDATTSPDDSSDSIDENDRKIIIVLT